MPRLFCIREPHAYQLTIFKTIKIKWQSRRAVVIDKARLTKPGGISSVCREVARFFLQCDSIIPACWWSHLVENTCFSVSNFDTVFRDKIWKLPLRREP